MEIVFITSTVVAVLSWLKLGDMLIDSYINVIARYL